MVNITTPQDIIQALLSDPELLRQARQAIMTEEVMALPAQFTAMLAEITELRQTQNSMLQTQNAILKRQDTMSETQASMLAEIAELRQTQNSMLETQASMLKTQDSMLAEIAELRQTQNSMLETQASMLKTQDSMLAEIAELRQTQNSMLQTQNAMLESQSKTQTDIRALHDMYRRQHDDLGRFRGNYAADAARQNIMEISILFAPRRQNPLRIQTLRQADLTDIYEKGFDDITALGLRERAWRTFMAPDLIAEVTEFRSSRPAFYIAVEASYTGDSEDLLRATDHARILRAATGLDAYPVVASVRLAPSVRDVLSRDATRILETNDRNAALWFQLREEELEALNPQ